MWPLHAEICYQYKYAVAFLNKIIYNKMALKVNILLGMWMQMFVESTLHNDLLNH